jgi:hypothetical protein
MKGSLKDLSEGIYTITAYAFRLVIQNREVIKKG